MHRLLSIRMPLYKPVAGLDRAVGTKYSSGQHDFDFHFGTWKTHNLLLAHPLSGSTTWIEFNGTVTVQKILDGRK
jgi:hypothetical protein